MPIYTILCPDCGHLFKSLVLKGTRMPKEWPCSRCGCRRVKPNPDKVLEPHPWETGHRMGCPCCGG